MAEFIEDQGFKEEVVKARPFLKPLVDAHGWVAIAVLKVSQRACVVNRNPHSLYQHQLKLGEDEHPRRHGIHSFLEKGLTLLNLIVIRCSE